MPPRGLGAACVVGDERVAVAGAEVPEADQPAVGQGHEALERHRRPADLAGRGSALRPENEATRTMTGPCGGGGSAAS